MSFTYNGIIRPYSSSLSLMQRLVDASAIIFAYWASLRFGGQEEVSPLGGLGLALVVLLFLTVGGMRQLYGSWRVETLWALVRAVMETWLWTLIAFAFLVVWSGALFKVSQLSTIVWLAMTPIILLVVRWSVRSVLHWLRSSGMNTRTFAVAGRTRHGKVVLGKVKESPWLGLRFVGYYDDRGATREGVGPCSEEVGAGSFVELVERAKAGDIDYIYIAMPIKAERRIVDLVNALADTTASVYLVPDFFAFELLQGKLSSLSGVPVISLFESPFSGIDGWLKRLEDILVASIILVIVAIPMLAIAAGIKLSSPGPVLFKQRRYGLNGKIVEIWKFRSMAVCEDDQNLVQAKRKDSRITKFGAFLRSTSLDELPQFINVLQGTMSVVGPRPHAVAHNEQYRRLIHGYMSRHVVKPGITGWAQINGWRGETDTLDKMQMRIAYDLEYVRNWSLTLDLKIILLTVFKGFIHKNAY